MPYLGLDPSFPEVSLKDAEETIEHIGKFDADERVFVVWSHDVMIHKTLDFYPKKADYWKGKGWKSAGRWVFLADLQQIAKKMAGKGNSGHTQL